MEDFTTYTKVDPNGHIELVGTNHIDWDAYANEDAYFYKDRGAGHFGNFVHRVDFKIMSASENTPTGIFWLLSNELGTFGSMAGNLLCTRISYSGTGYRIVITEYYPATEYFDAGDYELSLGTWYYLTITKVGTDFTVKIYSDSARTILLDTLHLTLHADLRYRYIYAANTYNNGQDEHVDLDIENLYEEVIGPFPTHFRTG